MLTNLRTWYNEHLYTVCTFEPRGGLKQVPSSLLLLRTFLAHVHRAVVLPGAILFAFDGIKRSNISNIGLLLLYILLATLPGAPLPGLQ